MEEKQNRYDDLDNLISTINVLLDELSSKDLKEDLEDIKYKYLTEKDELEEELIELEAKEAEEQESEYKRSVI